MGRQQSHDDRREEHDNVPEDQEAASAVDRNNEEPTQTIIR